MYAQTICTFFLQGRCKYGDQCRYEHPRDAQRSSGFGSTCLLSPCALVNTLTYSAKDQVWNQGSSGRDSAASTPFKLRSPHFESVLAGMNLRDT